MSDVMEKEAKELKKHLDRLLLQLGQPVSSILPWASDDEIWVEVSKAFCINILITFKFGRPYFQTTWMEEDLHDPVGSVVAVEKAIGMLAGQSVHRYFDALADAAELEQFVVDVLTPDIPEALEALEDALGYLHAVDFDGDPDWPGVRKRADAALSVLKANRWNL